MTEADIIGLLPAGGQGSRIAPLPCSKELYPVGFRVDSGGAPRAKVVSHYLLEQMRFAGIRRAYFVLRPGKWDIPAYFGDGSVVNMHIGYLMLGRPFGVPFTLDQAYPFVCSARIAFGFPDILLSGEDVFKKLLAWHSEKRADVTLGLTRVDDSPRFDKVEFDTEGLVREIHLGLSGSPFRFGWAIAVWEPSFTGFLHDYVGEQLPAAEAQEISAGHAIKAALGAGMRIAGVPVSEQPYQDIGTPGDLAAAVRQLVLP